MKYQRRKQVLTRLNKFIASCGSLSRRKADEMITSGRVEVNNALVTELGFQVKESIDRVYLDGELLKPVKKVYYVLNKPKGYVTTTDDEKRRPIVTELVPKIPVVFPVGRLDVNTTGILLLTNDGECANRLVHPSNGFVRTYIAKLSRPLDEEHRIRLQKGITVEQKYSRFISVEHVNKTGTKVRVQAGEGRNHFVKNLFSTLGYSVTELHRVSIGNLSADDIPLGAYKKIPASQIEIILTNTK